MGVVYADRSGVPKRRATRRAPRQAYDPLRDRAKLLSDLLWERSKKLADVLAPDEPSDQEPLSDHEAWMILEHAAISVSPMTWDDPDALTDLLRLRKMFAPELASDRLKLRASQVRKERDMLPDPSITPQSPEWEKRIRRLNRWR